MDHDRISAELSRINKSIPEDLKKGATKQVNTLSHEKAKIEKALQHKDLNPQARKIMERSLESGLYDRMKEVVDHNVMIEVDKAHTQKMEKAIRDGRLPDPRSREVREDYNKFMNSRK